MTLFLIPVPSSLLTPGGSSWGFFRPGHAGDDITVQELHLDCDCCRCGPALLSGDALRKVHQTSHSRAQGQVDPAHCRLRMWPKEKWPPLKRTSLSFSPWCSLQTPISTLKRPPGHRFYFRSSCPTSYVSHPASFQLSCLFALLLRAFTWEWHYPQSHRWSGCDQWSACCNHPFQESLPIASPVFSFFFSWVLTQGAVSCSPDVDAVLLWFPSSSPPCFGVWVRICSGQWGL